jgi:hypothetical protein
MINLSYEEAIEWMEGHYNHDGQMGDKVMDLCIQTLQRLNEVAERYDWDKLLDVDGEDVFIYVTKGEDWK